MLSHLDDDGPVRLDGVKLGVCEVMGLEIDEPKLGAFAGALNALDFPAQLLVRQHPPRLERLRDEPSGRPSRRTCPRRRRRPPSPYSVCLTDLEARDGILDRRFYAVCEFARVDDLRGPPGKGGAGRAPAEEAASFACSWWPQPWEAHPPSSTRRRPVEVEIGRRDMRVGGTAWSARCTWASWPRSLAPGFLQGLMAAGAPMDLSVHVGPIPTEQAARTLEWQKVRFESAHSLSLQAGTHHVPRGGDRPGGHHPAQRRGAARAGSGSFILRSQ